jgi:hypothetical protein
MVEHPSHPRDQANGMLELGGEGIFIFSWMFLGCERMFNLLSGFDS